jgi:hypothetical protein
MSSSRFHQNSCKAGEPRNRKPLGLGETLDGVSRHPQYPPTWVLWTIWKSPVTSGSVRRAVLELPAMPKAMERELPLTALLRMPVMLTHSLALYFARI